MRRVLLLTAIVSLLVVAAAFADETITTRPPNEFAQSVTTIDQGEKVTLRNMDVAGHDAVSKRKSDDGKPLFRSELIAPGESGPVVGTEYLVTGTYPFICTVHPGMDATLEVTSAGTPKPKPKPPQVSVKVASSDIRRVASEGKLKLTVRSTKAKVKVSARTKGAKLGSKTVDFTSDGKKTVTLKLSKAARKVLRGRSSTKVTATAAATDAAGQTAKASASRTLN